MKKSLLATCFFLSLLACDKLKSIKPESQEPVNKELERDTVLDEINTSEPEIEIPNTELGFMITYEGKYARQEKLFENEVLASRLKGLDRFNYDIFLKMWNTETPIILENGILHMSGCKAHDCPSSAYDFFVDLENDNINIFHFRSNMLKVYQEKGWIDLPEGFAREMEIKKNNAGIGNTESIESNYNLTTD